MSQLMEDLNACVRSAKITNSPFGKYQMMNITAEHAAKILDAIAALDHLYDMPRSPAAQDRARAVLQAFGRKFDEETK